MKEMIEREKERYDWEFMFLGANMDAVKEASRIGIDASRTASYVCDSKGIEKNFVAFSGAMAKMEEFDACCLDEVREDYNRRGRKRK